MTVQSRFVLALVCAGLCAVAGAATKCVTGGWPVTDTSVRAAVDAAPASGGAVASSGGTLETRVLTWAAADNFALDTRPARGCCILIR